MKVLIVEDEEGAATVLKHFIEPIASEIIVARNLGDALGFISDAVEIDIITLDLGLPDSGVEQTLSKIQHIRSLRPNSLIIVVTGHEAEAISMQAITAGADGVLSKMDKTFTAQGFIALISAIVMRYLSVPHPASRNVLVLEKIAQKLADIKNNENATPIVNCHDSAYGLSCNLPASVSERQQFGHGEP